MASVLECEVGLDVSRERLNAWTHLVGAVAAFIGAVWLLVIAGMAGDPWKIVSVAIYGFTLLVLYSASTVYHSVRGRKKPSCRRSITFRSTC